MKYNTSIFYIAICIVICIMPPTALAVEGKGISATINDIKFAPDEDIASMIIENTENASKSVDVAVFIFNYMPLADALIDAHEKGIKIRVLTDIRSSEKMQSDIKDHDISIIQYLRENGIEVRVYDATENSNAIMHQKFMLIDEDITILGSFNFQKAAQKHNSENFNVIQSAQFTALYRNEFNKLWDSKYASNKNIENAEKDTVNSGFGKICDLIYKYRLQLLFTLMIVSMVINIIFLLKNKRAS